MSFEVMAWAFEQYVRPASRKLVLIAMSDFTSFVDEERRVLCHIPRTDVLSAVTSLPPEEVDKQIRALLRSGVIRVAEDCERGGRQ
jgi:hypothetical protein